MSTPKRPPSVCYECCHCRVTFITHTPAPCPDCGRLLTVRAPGAEPYGGEFDDEEQGDDARVAEA